MSSTVTSIIAALAITLNCFSQEKKEKLTNPADTTKQLLLNEVVISVSRIPETILRSPVSADQLKHTDARNMASVSCFDAIENMKGVHVLTPSLGFKVINTRGFANTTNVRFTQLIDGIDNQAPHLGAPIANALGANDLDIDKIEIIAGTASALYGMNAMNGLVNIRTKSPFMYQGLSFQQVTGVNHVGAVDSYSPQLYSQTNMRYAKAITSHFAVKINGAFTNGHDWVADNRSDLASSLNSSTGLTGNENPAFDEVNSYGNESPNRKTLTLNGKNYVVARTGYREVDITDYTIQNYKGDAGLYYQFKPGHELSLTYKGALINDIYQRSNRFRLQNYSLNQFAVDYRSQALEFRSYLTEENTGTSYNIRSLAENMDRAFKTDKQWFADYTNGFNSAVTKGFSTSAAHTEARELADAGRYQPGTAAYNEKKNELTNINNWDYGAALRVKSYMLHSEALVKWDNYFPAFFEKLGVHLLSGVDHRTYIIVPDGNYFINPTDSTKNINYKKAGGFTQLNKELFNKRLLLSITLRADKSDYFNWKFNPRITAVYSPKEAINIRASYQSGYRFPSIFEGFSNVNSGGVKRVGGLKIMSAGIFENSYTKASIDAFQKQVNSDVNTLDLTQAQAIEKNKGILKTNPYTYLQPEYVRSFEFGFRGLALKKELFIDADFYYNTYDNFIAQVEASIPKTTTSDSIPTYLYSKTKQDRYRLWTNSQSKIYTYGASLGLKYRYNRNFSFLANATYSKLYKTDNTDGLEDGYNTPQWMLNGTILAENIWKQFGASITYRYQTAYTYVSFLVNGIVPEYATMDAQLNYTIPKFNIVAKIGAANIFNKPYCSMLGGPSVGGLYYLSSTYTLQKQTQQ